MLIGDVGLTTRSMFRNRSGRPSSAVRNAAPPAAAAAATSRPALASAWRPVSARASSEHRRRAGQLAEEQVGGQVRLAPARHLEDRPTVVRLELGRAAPAVPRSSAHRRPPGERDGHPGDDHPGRQRPPSATSTAGPLVVTTGSGGSPYTCGSSSSRKKAPAPPIPSSGSSPYSRACVTPAACSSASRACAVLTQLVERAELDRVRRARLGAGRLEAAAQPVVAHRALPGPAVVLAAVDHAERAGRHAVGAAVADVAAGRSRCRTRSAPARRSGTRPGRRRACSACRRPRPSASGWPGSSTPRPR